MSPSNPEFPRGTHSAPVPTCGHRCSRTETQHAARALGGGAWIGHEFERDEYDEMLELLREVIDENYLAELVSRRAGLGLGCDETSVCLRKIVALLKRIDGKT